MNADEYAGFSMTPFIKRNFLIAVSVVLFAGLMLSISRFGPSLESHIQHLEIIAISLMIMVSLVVMLFWALLGVFGGLASFLIAMSFLYRPLTDLNPYYYNVLILTFFVGSFIGYWIYRKISISNQEYTVTMEKIREDVNLVNNHMKNRAAEVSAMEKKIEDLLKLKNIADNLSLSLSKEEIIRIVSEETFNIYGQGKRTLVFTFDQMRKELGLAYVSKDRNRAAFAAKNGGIFDRWVLKNMKSLLVKDARKDFRFSVNGEEAKDDAVSLIVKPLVIDNNVLGLVRVDSLNESAFGQHELRILDIIGELAAVALENARLYRQTEELAIKDGLTGLYVHRYFRERLGEEVKRALHSKSFFAFLMLDIDDFKNFNDKYGHMSGDAVLKNVGHVLKTMASAGDVVARYGGEEFAFLVINCDRKKAVALAEDIRLKIQNSPIVLRREKCSVTVSIGVAVFPEDANDENGIISQADRQLYLAKEKGKNTVCSK